MTRTHASAEILCFGAKAAIRDLLGIVLLEDLDTYARLFVGDDEGASICGRLRLDAEKFRQAMAMTGTDAVVFYVPSTSHTPSDHALGVQLFGLDAIGTPVLYVEIDYGTFWCHEKRGFDTMIHVREAIALDGFEPLSKTGIEALDAETKNLFENRINAICENPVIDPDALENEGLSFAEGIDQATFIAMVEAAMILAARLGATSLFSVVLSATPDREARVYQLEPREDVEPAGERLLEVVLEICRPRGARWVYNDGHHYRRSGWDLLAAPFEIDVHDITALAKAQAFETLHAFLDLRLAPDDRRRALIGRSDTEHRGPP